MDRSVSVIMNGLCLLIPAALKEYSEDAKGFEKSFFPLSFFKSYF